MELGVTSRSSASPALHQPSTLRHYTSIISFPSHLLVLCLFLILHTSLPIFSVFLLNSLIYLYSPVYCVDIFNFSHILTHSFPFLIHFIFISSLFFLFLPKSSYLPLYCSFSLSLFLLFSQPSMLGSYIFLCVWLITRQ